MRFLSLLLSLLFSSSVDAQQIASFEATYRVLRNGTVGGSATLEVYRDDRAWVMRTHAWADRGLLGLVGLSSTERSRFVLRNGLILPLDWDFERNIAFRTTRERTIFDYVGAVALGIEDDARWELPLRPGDLDRHLVTLALMRDLPTAQDRIRYDVLDNGKRKTFDIQVGSPETIQTALGYVSTMPVVHIHGRRITRSWHAIEFGYLPVILEQVEPDGETYRLEIAALKQ